MNKYLGILKYSLSRFELGMAEPLIHERAIEVMADSKEDAELKVLFPRGVEKKGRLENDAGYNLIDLVMLKVDPDPDSIWHTNIKKWRDEVELEKERALYLELKKKFEK